MRNILLVVLACYTLQDVNNSFLLGRKEGVCQKHCLYSGYPSYIYNEKKKLKCACVEPQDDETVYTPTFLLSNLKHVTVTGGDDE